MARRIDSAKRKSGISRGDILNAAAENFRRRGYAATTLRDIAAAVGMQAGSLYYHFDSKEQILEEVLNLGIGAVFDAVKQEMERLPRSTPWRQRIERAIETHLAALFEHGNFTSAFTRTIGQAPARPRRNNQGIREAYEDYWKQMYEEAQKAGEIRAEVDLRILRLFLFGAMNWAIEWYRPEKGPLKAIAAGYAAMLFDGIGGAGQADTAVTERAGER
jgi:AcrR family transcriptional regulator